MSTFLITYKRLSDGKQLTTSAEGGTRFRAIKTMHDKDIRLVQIDLIKKRKRKLCDPELWDGTDYCEDPDRAYDNAVEDAIGEKS